MLPTVTEVLQLEAVRQGAPRVVAGSAGLSNPVRWVHVSEVIDIARELRGGELVLTTGIALPDEASGLSRYLGDLADVGVVGLAVELGRRYSTALPTALVTAADRRGVVLVELHRGTPFVNITESVHSLIVDSQLAELRASDEVHQIFTELSVEGASAAEVLRQVNEMTAAPVVLENLAHQVLAYETAGGGSEGLLQNWEARSRSVLPTEVALDGLTEALQRNGDLEGMVVGAGSVVTGVRDGRRMLLEAGQVADAAHRTGGEPRAWYRLPDVRLRGLLHLLRDDARLQTYAERELGPLLAYDAKHGSDLVGALETYLSNGGNKSAAASRAHLSRPAFYERLRKIERVLGVDLDSVESCLSLHVALLALDSVRSS